MTRLEAKDRGFTHQGFIYGFIKIYAIFEEGLEQPILMEKNWAYGILLDVFTWIDLNFYNNEGFELDLYEIDDTTVFNFYNFGLKFLFLGVLFLLFLMIFK